MTEAWKNGSLRWAAVIGTVLAFVANILIGVLVWQAQSVIAAQQKAQDELQEVRENYVPRSEIDEKLERVADTMQDQTDTIADLSLRLERFVTYLETRDDIDIRRAP